MTNLKVVLISEEYPPYTFGGIGSVCYDLARNLSKKEIETTVICGRSITNEVSVENYDKNLKVIRLPFIDVAPRFLWFQLQNLGLFSRLLRDQPIAHFVNPQVGAIAPYLKKLNKYLVTSIHGVPLVESKVFFNSPMSFWTVGDFAYNLLEYPLNHYFIKVCLASSDHIVVCSFTTLNEVKTVYGVVLRDNVSVIHNAIDFGKIESISVDSSNNAEHRLVLIYYGRLYWRKGIYYLLRSVANLRKNFSDIEVNIFGKGPLEKKIRELIHNLGLEDRVRLRWHVPYGELVKEIKTSDIVVVPSLYEAQSVSMLEAMACKKPVVAFDFPFTREVITNMYNGLLAKPGDVGDLSEKISLLLSDKILRCRLGQNAYDYVKQKHNWDIIVDSYIDEYRTILESRQVV